MSKKHITKSKSPKLFAGNPYNQELIASHHDAVTAAPWLAGIATPAPAAAPSPRLRVLCVLDGVEADHKVLDHFDDEVTHLDDEAATLEQDESSFNCDQRLEKVADLIEQKYAAQRQRELAEQKLGARLASVQIAGVDLDVSEEDGPIDDVHGEVKVGGQWVKVADYDLVFLDNETASVRYLAAGLPPSRVALVVNIKAERRDVRRQVIPATLTAILRRIGDLVADRRRQLLMPWGIEPAYTPAPSSDDAAVDEQILMRAPAITVCCVPSTR